jgi:hypothetical protein
MKKQLEKLQHSEDRLSAMEKQFNTMQSQITDLVSSLGSIKEQDQIDHIAKTLYNAGILTASVATRKD